MMNMACFRRAITAVALVLAAGGASESFGSYLLWQVDDPKIDYGYVVKSASEAGANAVRVKATDGVNSDYLAFWYKTTDGMTDTPMVKVQQLDANMQAGPTWADVFGEHGDYADNSWSFVIELVNYNTWEVVGVSQSATYSELVSAGHISVGEIDIPGVTTTPWTPTVYAAPEPTSGMLLLVGVGLLVLKRRRI